MAWLYLTLAGLLEVGWAVGLKQSDGFTRLVPSIMTVLSIAGSLGLLGLALKSLPLGLAYAIWSCIGIVGTAVVGTLMGSEVLSLPRVICIGLIAAGIIGLKLTSQA